MGRFPCVIYKFNHQDIVVSVPFAAMAAGLGGQWHDAFWAEISLEGLAYLAAEIMATNSDEGRGESHRDRSSRRTLVALNPRQMEKSTEQTP